MGCLLEIVQLLCILLWVKNKLTIASSIFALRSDLCGAIVSRFSHGLIAMCAY